MEQEILKPWQKQALVFLATEPMMSEFYLTGGTALAEYYLHHRWSDDLDFFTERKIDSLALAELAQRLKNNLQSAAVRLERLYDGHQYFFSLADGAEAKVEFAAFPYQVLNDAMNKNNLKIDSEEDIATNKIMALLDRFEPKDFTDLYFLLPKYSLDKLRQMLKKSLA